MFAPRFGIPEESGTGMAAGPLACFLYDYLGLKQPEMLIEQGWLMPNPSPSVIKVVLEFEQGQIVRLMAGGIGKAISAMTIEI
jgi:predicted PhzF superfamily epimerase YddE/YHI9